MEAAILLLGTDGELLRICFIGDVVGAPGKRALRAVLPELLSRENIDCCIINAENSSHGIGVNSKIITELCSYGANVITLGNHTFSDREFETEIKGIKNCVRPANITPPWPGRDIVVFDKGNERLGVINLLGQVDMSPSADNPYFKADELINELKEQRCTSVFLDFHAEATSEKQAMGYYLDGRVSVVAGTHTHVQTADERILPQGTGYITDCGMTGVYESILGMDIETSFTRLVRKIHCRYEPASGSAAICGIIFETNLNGRCVSIKRFCEYE
ncbi:MAG: TIGR00282 family metallophosphoesterase [Saccharofermentans sp.]|nr:TIGR00282 family metallophosphoesterase [Saccharofermentans sp.]